MAKQFQKDQEGMETRSYWLGAYLGSLVVLLLLWKLPWSVKIILVAFIIFVPIYLLPSTTQLLVERATELLLDTLKQ